MHRNVVAFPRLLPASLLCSLLVACAAGGGASSGSAPVPGQLQAGVQIWNGTKHPVTCRAALIGSDGRHVEIVRGLVVPSSARPGDASVVGDRNSVREAVGSVPPGTWTFVVEAGGHSGRLAASWPGACWAIAFVGPDGIRLVGDSAPRPAG